MNNTFSSNPWPGLGSYDDTGRYKFCGRGRATNELYSLISDNNVISLYGRSGIGKTSILKAGVTPLLVRRGYLPVYVRLSHEERILDETGDNLSYAECIIRCVETRMSENGCVVSEIRNKATSPNSPDFLWSYFCRVAFHAEQGKICTPVIILDQYEEIFQDRREDAALLMRQLYALVDDSRRLPDDLDFDDFRNRFRFVMSFRDDSLYRLEDVINEYNLTAFKENRYLLKALNRDDAQDVITLPGEGLVDSEVSNQILDKVISMSEGNNVDPAILSLLMYGLYEQMIKEGDSVVSRSLVEKSGDDIVHGFYMQGMSNIGGSAINYLEEHLVSSDGRRRAISEADIRSHVTDEELQALINRHILIKLERGKYADYELTHDILCAEAKKDREERTAKERIRKLRKYFLTMIAIVVGLFIVSLLIYRINAEIVRTTQEADSIKILNDSLNLKNDSLNLKNKLDELQKDSLKRLTVLYEEERDKYAKALKDKEEQNKLLIAKQMKIDEQEKIIESLSTSVIKNNIAGELSKNLPFSALSNVVQLKISGNLNGTDFAYLRLALERKLEHLDLSDAHIVRGGNAYYQSNNSNDFTEDNVVGPHLFSDLKLLKTIILPHSVTSIEQYAFYGCRALTSITIPNSVSSIEQYAFYGCSSLTSITIPNSVTTIGNSAFQGCRSLTSITIPNSVTYIGRDAFSGCTFYYFDNLSSMRSTVNWGAKILSPPNTNGLIIQHDTLKRCTSNATTAIIPNEVTVIDNKAFYGCSFLTSITLPNSVTTIGSGAFRGCRALTSITLPNSITSIEQYAFYGCSSLTSITLPNSITSIGYDAFRGCRALTSITIPNSVTSIGSGAFRDCWSLTSITIPNSVTSIGSDAFRSCSSLTSITLPNSVTTIGNYAFSGCRALTSITLPNSNTSIGRQAFSNCENLAFIYSMIDNIKNVQLSQTNELFDQFDIIPSDCMWHVPSGKSQEYKELSWWVPTWRIVEDSVPNKEVKATYSNNILTVDGVQYKMISVKGGTFMMGRTEEIAEAGLGCIVAEGGEEEGDTVYIDPSPHEVTLNDYAIGETEVSQDLWTAIMGYNPSSSKGYNLPVDSISWNECQHFIYKLNTLTGKNFRLPSEAEWEFAARGGNKSNRTPFSGSSNPYEVGWFEENSKDKIHPIKQKKPNELGLYDMSGNVFEFCLDIDRAGDSDIWRRMRGGSVFNIHNIGCVCSSIIGASQGDKSDGFGFRLAISE